MSLRLTLSCEAPLRTDDLGTIALAVDDDGIRVWSERVGGPP